MANNLHVSYDLYAPDKNYEAVIKAVKSLGLWAKIHKSYWYVNSPHSAREAVDIVWAAMDGNDTVYIVNATNNSAAWENIPDASSIFIRDQWLK